MEKRWYVAYGNNASLFKTYEEAVKKAKIKAARDEDFDSYYIFESVAYTVPAEPPGDVVKF